MDVRRLAAELVVALRGKRSQLALSRRLGYSTNVVYTWEAGRREPSASDFFRLALRTRVDLRAGLQNFLAESPEWLAGELASPHAVSALLRTLLGERKVAPFARALGTSRLTLTRWLAGSAEPRLPDLLRFVAATTERMLEFLCVFVSPEDLPVARGAFKDFRAQLRVAYELPWSHAVLRALELRSYRRLTEHRPGYLAKRLGISEAEELECLAALVRAKQIHWTGKHYRVSRVLTVDTRSDPAKNNALKRHWASVGLTRLGGPGLFSYNLFAVSELDYRRIERLHRKYFEDLRAIVSASAHPERVVLVNLQLFPLDGAPEESESSESHRVRAISSSPEGKRVGSLTR